MNGVVNMDGGRSIAVFEMGGAGTKWSLGLDTKANIPFANYDYFYHSCHSFTIFWDIINF